MQELGCFFQIFFVLVWFFVCLFFVFGSFSNLPLNILNEAVFTSLD